MESPDINPTQIQKTDFGPSAKAISREQIVFSTNGLEQLDMRMQKI